MVKDSSAYIELKSFTNITTLKSPTRVQTAYTAKWVQLLERVYNVWIVQLIFVQLAS